MQVRTSRFGVIDVAEDRIIQFPRGILGFPSAKRFALLEPADEACFFWLQCVDEPSLAFVVTDPSLFLSDYAVPIRPEQFGDLGLADPKDAQVFVIVNKVDQTLTANLQGPLVINTLARTAEQFVLAEKRWTTRHTLLRLATPAAAKSA